MIQGGMTRPVLKRLALSLVALMSLLLIGCESEPGMHRFQGPIFGTGYHITLYAELDQAGYDDLSEGIHAQLERIDALMSTYRDDSELSRFNRMPVGVPFFLSPETADVIRESLRVAQLSHHAFDITMGPVVNLWGFGPQARQVQAPEQAALAAALAKVDVHALHLDGNKIHKSKPVYVDLSGIAKGYGSDRVAEYLLAQGIENFLVEVGGEIRTHGMKPDGESWRVAVEKPQTGKSGVQRIIMLGDAAVATSGDYRNYYELEGRRYSHTIDPRTGRPIDNQVASVTVISKRSATADALATAFTVLGSDAGLEIAERESIAVYFIVRSDDGFDIRMSTAFEAYLEQAGEENES